MGFLAPPARTLAALAAALTLATAAPALAQDVGGNAVWLGQLGDLNVLDITQTGRDNKAGADYLFLLLGQNGVGNKLTLDQYGHDNALGTLFVDMPRFARGVWQRGDLNVIDITQRNTGPTGANIFGSVQQSSALRLPTDATSFNTLTAIQTSLGDATGYGGHYIGRVVQAATGDAGSAGNTAFIVQRGGGENAGNTLANLRQVGSGNSFGTIQSGEGNRIGEEPRLAGLPIGGIVQLGADNRGWLVQDGAQNLIEYLQQYGDANAARVRLSGNRNAISQIYQNNESWRGAALGNRVSISVSGDDNGGDGTGWVGELIRSPSLAVPGIAHAVFLQIGDDNDMSLAVLSGEETKYGMTQIGDGNIAHVAIAGTLPGATARANETAVFQDGDTNYVSHTVSGSNNTGAFREEGNRNVIVATQTGSFNTARVAIAGDGNNSGLSSLFGEAATLLGTVPGMTLERGHLVQEGLGASALEANSIDLDVIGASNAFTVYQSGSGNLADGTVTGSGNALAIVQQHRGNTAHGQQAGAGNSLGIHQF